MKNIVYLSDKYKVTVCEKEERKIDVFTALLADGTMNNKKFPEAVHKKYDGLDIGTTSVKTYYTSFEFDESAVIEITLPQGTETISVKPQKYADKVEFVGNMVRISTNNAFKLYLEPNGDIFGGLHIFCNKKKSAENIKKHLISFWKGVYTTENCEYIKLNEHGMPIIDCIDSNTTVYIAQEAVVNAAIILNNVSNVKICGNGVISLIDRCHGAEENFTDVRYWGAFRKNAVPNIYIRNNCSNIEICDVLLNCEFRGVVIRNSKNVLLDNVKIFASSVNADGINCVNTSELVVNDCYIHSADDCFCMYDSCDSIPWLNDGDCEKPTGICENTEVRNCVMSSNARPFVLGGHATGSKNPRNIIQNIYIHDCEIISTPYMLDDSTVEDSKYWSGLMRILSQSEQLVKNITFENIVFNVTKGHKGKAVHIEVRENSNASYTEGQGYRIEDIRFKNIKIQGNTENMISSLIKGRSTNTDGSGVSNVLFDNVVIGDKKISSDDVICEGCVSDVKLI